ncbi:hypothetical protein [Paracoccus aminophilus]|uniref:Uncharacterized protein n=1 Tax=Paracoccus aminophilus JCM 7686 TaxID=1367847 RepID=S5Y186_PARAH|nr:hypothetical protein [Paracoccus aminophilus]AGT09465.1 hypothetical protein JCM7686_2397 [Paracoccus aminophilus JCM 7686]
MTNSTQFDLRTAPEPRPAPSPIMTLFSLWKETAAWVDGTEPATTEELNAGAERKWTLRDAILALPSTDARDHLAKIVVSTSWGSHDLEDDGSGALWAEARALLIA